MNSLLPMCFYPMQKMILDDNHAFAESLALSMQDHTFECFTSPQKALDFLLNEYKPVLSKSDLLAIDDTAINSSTQKTIQIHLKKLKSLMQRSSQQDISVLLIDFHMPEITGSAFLKAIKDLPIKKILITGDSDYQIAIQAFNEGLIDAYVRKDDPNLLEKINTLTHELEWRYYSELTHSIIPMLGDAIAFLKNKQVIALFNQYRIENDIIAFYLKDMHGSFLTLDADGKQRYFLIRSRSQLLNMAAVAEEDGALPHIITNLQHGKNIPFFGDHDFWQIPANEWETHSYHAHEVPHEPTLVWTSIDWSHDGSR